LPATFRTIDSFSNGVATSIKSIDLNATTYQDVARLTYRLNAYIDSIATYDGSVLGSVQILPADISGRALGLAIPKGAMTAAQRAAVEAARMRAQAFGVNLTITEF
jgi:filamentous hemagglutinin